MPKEEGILLQRPKIRRKGILNRNSGHAEAIPDGAGNVVRIRAMAIGLGTLSGLRNAHSRLRKASGKEAEETLDAGFVRLGGSEHKGL